MPLEDSEKPASLDIAVNFAKFMGYCASGEGSRDTAMDASERLYRTLETNS